MNRVVVGIDGSKGSDVALEWAIAEAELRRAELRIVHAWHPPYVNASPLSPTAIDPGIVETAARAVLKEAVDAARTSGLPGVEGKLVLASAAHAVIAESEDADLVVVGARGLGGFAGLLLGSVSSQVVHHSSCPVVVVPTPR